MSNGNSKLPPNSASMSDERWLSNDERDSIGEWFQTLQPSYEAYEHGADLLDHAEAADELIAELAACIDYWWSKHDCMGPDDCYCGGYDGPMMTARRRVDALTKDTA